eukprot:scaffold124282_cov28-Prasinocladus_malaysianus.AAC.1
MANLLVGFEKAFRCTMSARGSIKLARIAGRARDSILPGRPPPRPFSHRPQILQPWAADLIILLPATGIHCVYNSSILREWMQYANACAVCVKDADFSDVNQYAEVEVDCMYVY